MILHRLTVSRPILAARVPTSARSTARQSNSRLFTQNPPLLIVSKAGPRPQLPFLHPATGGRTSARSSRTSIQYQLSRLITTERKVYLKDQLWKGAKWTVFGWAGLALISMMAFGLQSELVERRYHSPPEWSFFTKTQYRQAKLAENPDPNGNTLIDWSYIGQKYRRLIERLEDPTIDGGGLQPVLQEEGDIYVAGIGKAGLDISSKSEPWRRGYYTCLMGAAKAAENRDGWLRDAKTNIVFPPEHVAGPSNPRPKPLPHGARQTVAPSQENCVPVFEPAETFYMKILTTHGFNSRQRLDAALAYADWLDFKGLSSTAEDMYDWGLDIAMGSAPMGVGNAVDIKTGVISDKATHVSSNLLRATTSLAIHHARHNNLAAALPIFLSVLRARRQLPDGSSASAPGANSKNESSLFSTVKFLLMPPPYPPPPPTGDEVPFRTPTAICEEAAIMSHIGEILFASSAADATSKQLPNATTKKSTPPKASANQLKGQQSGLSWTREAVDLAEETLVSTEKDDEEARNRCSECLAVGMDNWSIMVAKMLKDERQAAAAKEQKTGSWFWGSGGEAENAARWERESRLVEARLGRVQRLLDKEADRKANSGGFFFM